MAFNERVVVGCVLVALGASGLLVPAVASAGRVTAGPVPEKAQPQLQDDYTAAGEEANRVAMFRALRWVATPDALRPHHASMTATWSLA